MAKSARIRELPSGALMLSLEGAAAGLVRHGVQPADFEALPSLSEAEREASGNQLDRAACSIAAAFLEGAEPFWEADAMLNALMHKASWKAPLVFWRIFTAFEDSETAEDPVTAAVGDVRAALEEERDSSSYMDSPPDSKGTDR